MVRYLPRTAGWIRPRRQVALYREPARVAACLASRIGWIAAEGTPVRPGLCDNRPASRPVVPARGRPFTLPVVHGESAVGRGHGARGLRHLTHLLGVRLQQPVELLEFRAIEQRLVAAVGRDRLVPFERLIETLDGRIGLTREDAARQRQVVAPRFVEQITQFLRGLDQFEPSGRERIWAAPVARPHRSGRSGLASDPAAGMPGTLVAAGAVGCSDAGA